MASIDPAGDQGPWSPVAPFTYKPSPGLPTVGPDVIRYQGDSALLELPPPPPGLHYRVALSSAAGTTAPAELVRSNDGRAQFPRPTAGEASLLVGWVDSNDGTVGPIATQKVQVPPMHRPSLWLLLLPLLALL